MKTHDPVFMRPLLGPKTGKTNGRESPKSLTIESDVNLLC